MEVRWSPEAADDLAAIAAYIRKDDSAAAQRTAKNMYARGRTLDLSASRQRGPRERHAGIAAAPLPFIVVYRITAHAVEIVNIIHGAQRWP
ncbi:MAG: type II toxin-antitoxin system RelE/ParE family toxin [Bryobacteraceae bacterium]|jgi:plasmid stabilization system protein ParE